VRFRTLILALTTIFPLVPLFALAQSKQPTPECQHACSVEYQERIDQCEKKGDDRDRNACYEQADLASRTCLAICH